MLIFSLVILQVVIFVGMVFMLRRVMEKNVVAATRHLEELNQEYLKKEEEVTRRLEEAKRQAEDIVSKARLESETLKEKVMKETNDESESILKKARSRSDEVIQQADKARARLIAEIEERISSGAIDKAIELIQHTLPEKLRKDIHSQWVGELMESGFKSVERLNIPKEIKEVKVVSAFKLNDDEHRDLSRKVKELLGREAGLKEESDPNIVAGIVIHIGSLILDGSLKNKIQECVKDAKRAGTAKET